MKTGFIDKINRIDRIPSERNGTEFVNQNLYPVHLVKRPEQAFTMIEIAIAMGVIGFALVAIIGVLPIGLSSQKDNREETTISQDAPYFLNAIRNGEIRTNASVFANSVESITISNIYTQNAVTYYNTNLVGTNGSAWYGRLTNDANIIGLLSFPEYDPREYNGTPPNQLMVTNTVTAIVRAMSGSAAMQSGTGTNMAFRYQMTVENVPWNSIGYYSIDYGDYAQGSPDWTNRYLRALESQYLTNSLHEVRLRFAWPVLPNGTVGPNRLTLRTLIGSYLWQSNNLSDANMPTLWFFQPQLYTTNSYNTNWL